MLQLRVELRERDGFGIETDDEGAAALYFEERLQGGKVVPPGNPIDLAEDLLRLSQLDD